MNPRLSILWLTMLAAVALGVLTPDGRAQGRPLRVRGTVVRSRYLADGESILSSHSGKFAFDLDPSGKWFVETECTQAPGKIFLMGFDGQTTVELETHLGTFAYESDTNKTAFLTPETSTAVAKVYAGNEFPFDLMPPSQFAWLVLASFEYQNNTNHLGRIGDLFGRLPGDPFAFALKMVPKFRKDWPHVMEKAEIFFDINQFPKDPIGLRLPTDEEEFVSNQIQWEKLRSKQSGVRVGFVESSHPIAFGEIRLPSRYRFVVSRRAGEAPDWDPTIGNRSHEMHLEITEIAEAPKVSGLPQIVSPTVLVKDHRFRKVNETVAMEYLAYPITDKRWKSVDDPILVARALHNMARSERFGNTRNKWVKFIGSGVLILVFFLPLIRFTLAGSIQLRVSL